MKKPILTFVWEHLPNLVWLGASFVLAVVALAIVFCIFYVIKESKFNKVVVGWSLFTCCLTIVLILIWWDFVDPMVFYGIFFLFIACYYVIVVKGGVEKKEEKNSYLSSYIFYTLIKENLNQNFKRSSFNQICHGFLKASLLIYYFSLHHVWSRIICLVTLILLSPKAAILLVILVFYWGVFLLLVDKNTQCLNSFNLEIKEYLTFDTALQKGLLKLSLLLTFLIIGCLLFNNDLLDYFVLISRCCLTLILFLSYNINLGFFVFPAFNIIFYIVLCYLVVCSYNYSSKSWIFIFNSSHILLYIAWCFFVSYEYLAIYYQTSLWFVHVCSSLYFFVWLGGLIISLKVYLGSWEFLKQCWEDPKIEPSKKNKIGETPLNHQEYSVKAAMLASHKAMLFLKQNKIHYNKTYIRRIVLVYAYLGWVLDNMVKLNGLFALLMVFGSLEGLIFVLSFNTVGFVLIICINCLSYDKVWYCNFKKANGQYVLTTIGWNMLCLTTTKIVKTIKILAPGTVYGVMVGYNFGYYHG